MNRNRSSIRLAAIVGVLGVIAGVAVGRAWPDRRRAGVIAPAGATSEPAEGIVRLSAEAIRTYGIRTEAAAGGRLDEWVTVPGQVHLNGDHVAHITPRVSGIVREVRHKLGDSVRTDEVLAVLESRELADAKAADLAATSRQGLVQARLTRTETLFKKGITSEDDLLKARQAFAESEIDHRTCEAKLHALGLSDAEVAALHSEKDTDYSRFEIKAPFDGTLIDKHLTLGEVVNLDTRCFVLADLSDVWVDITVYPADLGRVATGQAARIRSDGPADEATGEVALVSPVVDDATQTATARVVLKNSDMRWKPGTFVRVEITIGSKPVGILLPLEAIQTVDGQSVVYVETPEGFETKPVRVGRSNATQAEVISGVKPGERVVVKNAFLVKSQGMKRELGEE